MADPVEAVSQPRLKLQALEQECTALQAQLEGQRALNEQLKADVDLLQKGIFPPGTWPVLALFLAVLAATGFGGAIVWRRAARNASVSTEPAASLQAQLPHLLVTSDPPAEIVLDGVPRGSTPLLLTMPARNAEHRVTLTAPGRPQQTRRVRIQPQAGAHLHLKLPTATR